MGRLQPPVLTGADDALSAALIEPVLTRFTETLDAVAAERSDLEPKSTALIERLQNFLEPPDPEMPSSFPDDGMPF